MDSRGSAVSAPWALELAMHSEANRPADRHRTPFDSSGSAVSNGDKLPSAMKPRSWASREIVLARCSAQQVSSAKTSSGSQGSD